MTSDTDRIDRMKKFETSLAELVEAHTPAFQEAVRSGLPPEEKLIFEKGMPLYSQETGRWWDPWGIPDSVFDFKWILEQEDVPDRERLLAFAVLIYHDSGYPRLENSADYAKSDLRDYHMRVGAMHVACHLCEIRSPQGNYLFGRDEISSIFDAVIKHDDKYLGDVSNASRLLNMFMDGDNIFIPTFVSAYKDFVSRYGRPKSDPDGSGMSGEEFIRMRQSYFFAQGEDEALGQTVLITPESDKKFTKKRLPIFFESTKHVLSAHMIARTEKMERLAFDYASSGDWQGFLPYAKEYLEGSIEAARQEKSYDMMRFGRA